MIYPNMATTLGYVFTDANISSTILKKLLKKNIEKTFNAISCDGDTSTNDMVGIFATGAAKNKIINAINDERIDAFEKSLHSVLLNLAKRVTADGEGASKFISVMVENAKSEIDAKKIAFSIANYISKNPFAGDPNWRIIMAIGKSQVSINQNKINLSIGEYKILEKGEISKDYNEILLKEFMNEKLILKLI